MTHGPFSAMLKGLVETMTQSLEKTWCRFSQTHGSVAEPGTLGIQIPALKFTVKENCRALTVEGSRTLVDLQCARRFGIKIVGISVRGDEGTLSSRNYPGAKDVLKAGYECWVLPFLANYIMIDDADSLALRLSEAYEHIYKVQADSIEVEQGTGLFSFMEEFNLSPKDLNVNYLPGRMVTYKGSRAASICTRPFAEHFLLQLRKAYWMSYISGYQPAFACWLQRLGIVQEGEFVLSVLNMRNNFFISPLAVIHGGDGWRGLWELPERTTTILWPQDRLVFLDTTPLEEAAFKACIEKLNEKESLLELDCVKKSLDDANLFPGSAVEPKPDANLFRGSAVEPKPKAAAASKARKRPTRRGRGGKKRQAAQAIQDDAQAVQDDAQAVQEDAQAVQEDAQGDQDDEDESSAETLLTHDPFR
eukprot:Skav212190  [mRNA]  locus=scaffold754:561324:564057:- [translate_table: standard]